jgi:hypothetical protein
VSVTTALVPIRPSLWPENLCILIVIVSRVAGRVSRNTGVPLGNSIPVNSVSSMVAAVVGLLIAIVLLLTPIWGLRNGFRSVSHVLRTGMPKQAFGTRQQDHPQHDLYTAPLVTKRRKLWNLTISSISVIWQIKSWIKFVGARTSTLSPRTLSPERHSGVTPRPIHQARGARRGRHPQSRTKPAIFAGRTVSVV